MNTLAKAVLVSVLLLGLSTVVLRHLHDWFVLTNNAIEKGKIRTSVKLLILLLATAIIVFDFFEIHILLKEALKANHQEEHILEEQDYKQRHQPAKSSAWVTASRLGSR